MKTKILLGLLLLVACAALVITKIDQSKTQAALAEISTSLVALAKKTESDRARDTAVLSILVARTTDSAVQLQVIEQQLGEVARDSSKASKGMIALVDLIEVADKSYRELLLDFGTRQIALSTDLHSSERHLADEIYKARVDILSTPRLNIGR